MRNWQEDLRRITSCEAEWIKHLIYFDGKGGAPRRFKDDRRRAYRYALPYRFLRTGMRLRDFAEALALGDDGTLEITGEDATGSAEQPEDKKGCGVGG